MTALQAHAVNHKHSQDDCEYQEVRCHIRPEQSVRAKFVVAKPVEPNHEKKRYDAGRVQSAVEGACIPGIRSNHLHQKCNEPSPNKTISEQIQNRAGEIDGWPVCGNKNKCSKSVREGGTSICKTAIPIAWNECPAKCAQGE